VLSHGAGPNLPPADPRYHPKFAPKETLYELAVRTGRSEIATLLLRHGATPSDVTLSPEEEFNIAVAALDRSRAESIAAQHPAVLGTTTAIFEAARRDHADVVRLLLELGMAPDVENAQHQRALHEAASANSLNVAKVLIDAGADVDAVGQWGGSAMGAASHGTRRDMLALLAPHSNDIWEVTFAGFVDRMGELLREKPERARVVTKNGHTPLMWLPYEDEDQAITAARLLMSHGANPATVNSDGETAASRADAIGMHRLAAVLRGKGAQGASSTSNGPRTESDYDERVQALLDAYHLGTPQALERHYAFTWHRRAWSGLRSYVQLDFGRHADDPDRDRDITIDDARWLIAREMGSRTGTPWWSRSRSQR
jgi:ankyrin repeat protein